MRAQRKPAKKFHRLGRGWSARWVTVCVVSMMEIHLFFVGIPLVLVAVLGGWFLTRKSPHAATYNLSEKWTHPPILWAATDEAVGGGHGGHGGSEFTVGGGASGTW